MGKAKRYVMAEFLKVLISSILIIIPVTVAVAIRTGHPTVDRFQVIFVTMATVEKGSVAVEARVRFIVEELRSLIDS